MPNQYNFPDKWGFNDCGSAQYTRYNIAQIGSNRSQLFHAVLRSFESDHLDSAYEIDTLVIKLTSTKLGTFLSKLMS
jgi:hypothetical protein